MDNQYSSKGCKCNRGHSNTDLKQRTEDVFTVTRKVISKGIVGNFWVGAWRVEETTTEWQNAEIVDSHRDRSGNRNQYLWNVTWNAFFVAKKDMVYRNVQRRRSGKDT